MYDGAGSLREQTFPSVLLTDEKLVTALTRALERALRSTSPTRPLPDSAEPASVFFSVTKPDISVHTYVRRLVKYSQCSPAAFGAALVYMDRLARQEPNLAVSHYNLHRLLLTSVCLGAKFLDDRCFSNAHYARVGGIASVVEMNRLELHLLKLLDYRLFVSNAEYLSKERMLLGLVAPPPSQPAPVPYLPPTSPLSSEPCGPPSPNARPQTLRPHVHRPYPYQHISHTSQYAYQHYAHPMHTGAPVPHHPHVAMERHQQPYSATSSACASSLCREVSPVAVNHAHGGSHHMHHQPRQQQMLQYSHHTRGSASVHNQPHHHPQYYHNAQHHQRTYHPQQGAAVSGPIAIPCTLSSPEPMLSPNPSHPQQLAPITAFSSTSFRNSASSLHRSRTAHDLPNPSAPMFGPFPSSRAPPLRGPFAPCAAAAAHQSQLLAARQTQSMSSLAAASARVVAPGRQQVPDAYARARAVPTIL